MVIIWIGGIRLKLDVQGQRDERIFMVDGQRGMGRFENWAIFMGVTCVSFLI